MMKSGHVVAPQEVALTVGSNTKHYQQIFTGFSMLARQGAIRLKYSWGGSGLLAQIDENRIFYDVIDGYALDRSGMDQCDIYYKRSHYSQYLSSVENGDKVRPLGLNYEVYPDRLDWHAPGRNLRLNHSAGDKLKGLVGPIRRRFQPHLNVSRLQAPPREQAPGVMFLTRTWEPDDSRGHGMPRREEINEMRAECISRLRSAFGERCIAGFSRTAYAERHYPQLLAPVSSNKVDYLKLMRDFATVCIATTGLHGSIGWKLGEYVAHSKAIVSEPLDYLVPAFSKGKHYLEFTSARACVDLVLDLVNDPAKCMNMRQANRTYYAEYLRPDRLVARTLTVDSAR
ncbi:MAG: hypothetical protein CMQ49_00905 [Gammaproteobacteria bacterium]|nr:hypothetical protein [Gammaproteobacteria bacterium]